MARRITPRIRWTESAWLEVEEAAAYIARDSPRYASALVEEVRGAARSLKKFPRRGRVVPEIGEESVREIFVKSYRLVYEIREREIVILALLHGARRFPGSG